MSRSVRVCAAGLLVWLGGWGLACRRSAPTSPGRGRPESRPGGRTTPPIAKPQAADAGAANEAGRAATRTATQPATQPEPPRDCRVVHVFVALCDNRHQGIVPVPKALGNGQDARNNLYWGAMYGVKTFFRRSPHWKRITVAGVKDGARREAILDVAAFRLAAGPRRPYVYAEAYDGARMKSALADFFAAAAGRLDRRAVLDDDARRRTVPVGGRADLVCFVGHNGLMDTPLADVPRPAPLGGAHRPAGAVVLACRSRAYFAAPLAEAGCTPLITTAGLMAPEAYTLDAILRARAAGAPAETVHLRAAEAYARYQRCSLRAAKRLFVAGRR